MSLLDPRAWLAGIGLLALSFGLGYYRGHASEKTRHEAAVAAARAVSVEESARRITSIERVAHEARQEAELRAAAADRARAESRRLRGDIARLAARAAPACRSETGGDPIGVLADVLGRADERAGELARVADDARARGATCERAYDALTR